jgi:hypothetical protein
MSRCVLLSVQDEAYRLNPKRGASFNGEVLDELTNALTSTEFKGKMVTILAGYEAEVEDLLEANPGLPSRFPVRYRFTPFSAAESFQVLDYQLGLKGIRLVDGEVSKKLMPEMEELIESASWGNGRDLETLAALSVTLKRSPRLVDTLSATNLTVLVRV